MSSLSRFQGAMLGVLVGDCLGAPFEGMKIVSKAHACKYFAQLLDSSATRLPFKPYTDDTIMSKSVALSLIHCRGVDPTDMAKRFVTEYFSEPKRGYGSSVGQVFSELRSSSCEDPFGPAARAFGGMGSFGNGAAMRVTPIPLFCGADSSQNLIQSVTACSQITHSNELAIRGACLQALAVQGALQLPKNGVLDVVGFTDGLISQMREIEGLDPGKGHTNSDPLAKDPETSYVKKLEIVKSFLAAPSLPPREDVDEFLGMDVSAIRSVPTALYCFLAAQKPIPGLETDNIFQRTLMTAFSLGGDTDTIGSMAGGIAGAALGVDAIPSGLLKHCEGYEQALRWGEDLFKMGTGAKQSAAGSR